jgi:hypothetical protein
MHARVAADALERLLREVQLGRAEWSHPQTVRDGADALERLSTATAAIMQQLAAAHGELAPPGPQTTQALAALHAAGQHTTTAATQLRRARRTLP